MKYADIPILMYHEIGYQNSPWCVSPTQFEQQMLFLKQQGYRTITLAELKKGVGQQQETNEKSVVLTFDDGRSGVYRQAYPLLKKLGFTATIYIVPHWTDGKDVPEEETYSGFLSWSELQELAGDGFEIGSHSLRHLDLTALDEKTVIQELAAADELITSHLGKTVRHFAYPHGKSNETVQSLVQQRYETAVTIEKGFSRQPGAYARQWILNEITLDTFGKLLQRPRLSVCLIVKNEELFLESCLASVQGVADEIIIVDTGSTDGTKKIARKFTDRIYDFAWCDDFAAARNESLKYARGDWVLLLDADEMINQDDRHFLLEAVNQWDVAGYRLLTRNYSNDSSISGWVPVLPRDRDSDTFNRSFSGWYPSLKVRLFQRKPEFIFTGKVHELVDGALEQAGGRIRSLPVPVHHYGARKGNSQEKVRYHLELQKQKIQDDPHNAKAYYELGVQYLHLGQLAAAEKALTESVRLDPVPQSPLLNLAIVRQKQGNYDQAITTYQQVLAKNRQSADACFGLGFCYFRKEELEKAADFFHQAITHNPLMVDAYINLGAVYERLEKYTEAAEMLRTAAQLSPRQPRVYYNMGVIQEKLMNLPLAIGCYEQAIKLHYVRREELQDKVVRMKRFVQEMETEEKEPLGSI